MDSGVVDVNGTRRDTFSILNAEQNIDVTENSTEVGVSSQDNNEALIPEIGMVFESDDAARSFYDTYARRVGFSTNVGSFTRSNPDGPIVTWEFLCSREVFKRKNVESCNALLKIERKDPNSWVVTKFVEDHNHSMANPGKVLRPRRNYAGTIKNSVPETAEASNELYITLDGGDHMPFEPNHPRNMGPTKEGSVAPETYNAAMNILREGTKKVSAVEKSVAKVTPTKAGGNNSQNESSKKASSLVSELWPLQDAVPHHINLNDGGISVADLNQPMMTNHPTMGPVSMDRDGAPLDETVVLTCFKSMTWVIENKNSTPGSKVAVINLRLQDYGKTPSGEDTEVQFRATRHSLESMLRSMGYISQQLSVPANRVAVINLKLQDTKTTSGQTEVKFQVSKDTLGSMLRSMAHIREQL
ncbi:hypothetical protein ACFE04_002682 [Oxalis oulophora]